MLTREPGRTRVRRRATLSPVDLSLFQIWAGMAYAFPLAFAGAGRLYPAFTALADSVAARPNVASYLASAGAFCSTSWGIFRRYPELDLSPGKARPEDVVKRPVRRPEDERGERRFLSVTAILPARPNSFRAL